ncbi:MAG TPA: neutral zinc metallopeptidase [Polyangia bacterium]|nr:neutral zinc metallopeptidase [Polyangia bacterium]
MDTEGRRRSDNFEDRGAGRAGGGGMAPAAFAGLLRMLGVRGTLILVVVAGIVYFVAPAGLKQAIFGALTGGEAGPGAGSGGSVCAASPAFGKACDFSRVVLASTEDVWAAEFGKGALPDYGRRVSAYRNPTLVVFSGGVATGGCGNASADIGPFYCPGDGKLYIDPSFYDTMARRLRAPGDFAQAYVIAHEVGHHVQNLLGAREIRKAGEDRNHTSVRLELQADCLAGVWGHTARASLAITEEDLREALTAAHNIGDDALGHRNAATFTHGSSQQRTHWFKRGFDSGDARQCDTFAAAPGAL